MDRNLKMIQELTGVTVGVRGEKVFFNGPPEKVEDVRRLIVDIIDNLGKGRPVTSEEIEIQSSIWPKSMVEECKKNNIQLV